MILWYYSLMKTPDLDRARSEKPLSREEFLTFYNSDLPPAFPRATVPFLNEFRKRYPGLFRGTSTWSLGLHRKKFMDWLPQYLKSLMP